MRGSSARRLGLATASAFALVAAAAAQAWACTSLATITPNPVTAAPGSTVNVTGDNFVPDAGPVQFRFSSLASPVIATARPNQAGEVSASFRVPDAQPGSYVLLATQTQDGEPVFGTPARAVLVIPGASGETAPGNRTVGQDQPQPPFSEPAPVVSDVEQDRLSWVVLAVTGIAGLALFAGGLAAFIASLRRRPAAQVQR